MCEHLQDQRTIVNSHQVHGVCIPEQTARVYRCDDCDRSRCCQCDIQYHMSSYDRYIHVRTEIEQVCCPLVFVKSVK
jgi:hypothetical protein